MNPDLTVIARLFKVNGLTPQSPSDQIQNLLSKAGYKPEEIQLVLANLSNIPTIAAVTPSEQPSTPPIAVQPGVPVPPFVASAPQPDAPTPSVSPVSPKKGSNIIGLSFGLVILLLVVGGGAYFYLKFYKGL